MSANDTEAKRWTVTVHIVTYNSASHTQKCLDAVFAQTWPIVRVVIVDNASTDNTLAVLRQYEAKLDIIRNRTNLGFAAAHNQAIRHSDSDAVLVLNPDVTLDRAYVARLVTTLEQRTDAGSATGQLRFAQCPDRIDSTGIELLANRRAIDRGAGELVSEWQAASEPFGVSGAAAMYSRNMIDHINIDGQFFDEDFFAYKEDVDVAWRARNAGWKAGYVPEAVAWHERGWKKGSRTSQPLFIRKHSYINRYYTLMKNESMGGFFIRLPVMVPYDLASFGYLLWKEPKVLAAWGDFFRLWKKNWEKRKQIRAITRI